MLFFLIKYNKKIKLNGGPVMHAHFLRFNGNSFLTNMIKKYSFFFERKSIILAKVSGD